MLMRRLFLFSLLLVTLGAPWISSWDRAAHGQSADARIGGLLVKVVEQRLLASLLLEGAFDDSFRRRIESGLPTDLVFRFELARDRRSWFDKSVADSRLQVIAMYNAVTGEYLINFKHDGNLIESRVVRSPEELRRAMTELVDFPVFSVDDSDTDERLRLRVRAELGTRNVLAFIPRTRATEWVESPEFRLADP